MALTEPKVGDGATIIMYTDRHAATVVAVNGKTVKIQRDTATRTDSNGMSESQSYSYAPNIEAQVETFTLRATGRYVRQGDDENNGTKLTIGLRRTYHDFSF